MPFDILIQLALIVSGAKIFGEVFERLFKQPAVLAEIIAGAVLGKSLLHWIPGTNEVLRAFAGVGAVLLLFEVGLESDLDSLKQILANAILVGFLGVAFTFALTFEVCQAFGLSTSATLFIGAAISATSVGVSARVFSDYKMLPTIEARIVLGAAVVDDVIGLVILSALSGSARETAPGFSVLITLLVAIGFLVLAVVIGQIGTPVLLRYARQMKTRAAVSSAAVVFCLICSALAQFVQLAPIIGAFAAGLELSKTAEKVHFEQQVRSIAELFVPVFFVVMGAEVNLSVLNLKSLILAGALIAAASLGKAIASAIGSGRGANRVMVSIGMMPRGEVSLIVANIAFASHVIDASLFAAIVLVVIGTTVICPPLLSLMISRRGNVKVQGASQ